MLWNNCVLVVDMRVGNFFALFLPTCLQRTFPQVSARFLSAFGGLSRSYTGFTTTFVLLTTITICFLILLILIRAEE